MNRREVIQWIPRKRWKKVDLIANPYDAARFDVYRRVRSLRSRTFGLWALGLAASPAPDDA
jgi:hypothetical protein